MHKCIINVLTGITVDIIIDIYDDNQIDNYYL